MGALPLARVLLAAAVVASTACTLWAALDDPYKSEATDSSSDAGLDVTEASAVIKPGFVPYAIAAYGDTVYVVDRNAEVHVATDAGTSFSTFFSPGDAGDVFHTTNRIAASSAGVFWTVADGIRHCALDGGDCGLLRHGGSPALIAAGGSVVAWSDDAHDAGIGRCTVPLSQCAPVPTLLNEPATGIAVGPDGTVAWATGKAFIGFAGGGQPRTMLPVAGYAVSLLATDVASGNLYWIGNGIGVVPFDGGAGYAVSLAASDTPSQFSVEKGAAYWTVPLTSAPNVIANTAFEYCRFASGAMCNPGRVALAVGGNRPDLGIVSTSRDVLTILAFAAGGDPQLYVWPVP
jgi:hypothetical protein